MYIIRIRLHISRIHAARFHLNTIQNSKWMKKKINMSCTYHGSRHRRRCHCCHCCLLLCEYNKRLLSISTHTHTVNFTICIDFNLGNNANFSPCWNQSFCPIADCCCCDCCFLSLQNWRTKSFLLYKMHTSSISNRSHNMCSQFFIVHLGRNGMRWMMNGN